LIWIVGKRANSQATLEYEHDCRRQRGAGTVSSAGWSRAAAVAGSMALLLAMASGARADARQKAEERPLMAVVPPTVRIINVSQGEDAQVNPDQIMSQVIPRVANDAARKKWPFRILPPDTAGRAYAAATGHDRGPTDPVQFADLKPLAEKIDCRYLLVFHVNELASASHDELFSHTLNARANVDLSVYDREKDAYVWQTNKVAETHHPMRPGNVGLRREQDGALNAALTQALEPFARGDRKMVDRPKLNVVVIVKKVLADGKRVLLDAGRDYNVRVGDVFKSVESDLEVRIVEVLDNGSFAEIVAGEAKDAEVLKHKQAEPEVNPEEKRNPPQPQLEKVEVGPNTKKGPPQPKVDGADPKSGERKVPPQPKPDRVDAKPGEKKDPPLD